MTRFLPMKNLECDHESSRNSCTEETLSCKLKPFHARLHLAILVAEQEASHLEVRVPHVVHGEDEAARVVVDGLPDLVDEALLELEADLLARLGERDGAVAAGLRHLARLEEPCA